MREEARKQDLGFRLVRESQPPRTSIRIFIKDRCIGEISVANKRSFGKDHLQGIELRITRLAPGFCVGYSGNLARFARSERGIDALEESLMGRGRGRRVRQRGIREEKDSAEAQKSGRPVHSNPGRKRRAFTA